jgi:hypothetical protein
MRKSMRKLSSEEQQAVQKLALEFESEAESKQLLEDLNNCSVTSEVSDGSILIFNISGYQRPSNHGTRQFVSKDGLNVEGVVNDDDGEELEVLLLADSNCRIYELELIKYSAGSVIKPKWESFKVKCSN